MNRMLYYTATVVTMVGSDTNAYGEACEPGHGYTEQSGWWNPDRDYWSVHPGRDQAQPDTYPSSGELPPAHWLAIRLTDRLGPIDHFDGERTFYSAGEATWPGHPIGTVTSEPAPALIADDANDSRRHHPNPAGVKTLTAAGHAHGFTDQEILKAARLLGLAMPDNSARPHIRPEATDEALADPRTSQYPESSASMRGFVVLRQAEVPVTLPGVPDLPPHPPDRGTHQGTSR